MSDGAGPTMVPGHPPLIGLFVTGPMPRPKFAGNVQGWSAREDAGQAWGGVPNRAPRPHFWGISENFVAAPWKLIDEEFAAV